LSTIEGYARSNLKSKLLTDVHYAEIALKIQTDPPTSQQQMYDYVLQYLPKNMAT